ncbi:MAG: cytochrome c oxidase subunit II [Pyrinomonadaceae bacterium]|nr:cytochrome c oxidase subunit II [Pyrinomonadaceae bacterium]
MLAGCTGPSTQSSVDPMGPQARHLSRLWWFFCYSLSAIFVIVVIVLLLSTYKGWRESRRALEDEHDEERPLIVPEPERERSMKRVVLGATLLTGLMLFVYLIMSFITGRAISSPLHAENVLTIEVKGHQWWWEARYSDPTPSRIFTTANEIHIPVGRPVMLKMTSTDVIHSFWVPNLMGKKDLIPGKDTTLMFQADRPGVYRGQCAEYCGLQHAHMAFIVVAESEEQFAAWREAQINPALEPQSDSEKRGQQVFLSSPCIMCHTVRGTQAGSLIGPDLTHVGSRQTIAAATLPNTRGHLSGWIVDSQSVKPGNRMPPNSLNPEDLQALLDYLQSLK